VPVKKCWRKDPADVGKKRRPAANQKDLKARLRQTTGKDRLRYWGVSLGGRLNCGDGGTRHVADRIRRVV